MLFIYGFEYSSLTALNIAFINLGNRDKLIANIACLRLGPKIAVITIAIRIEGIDKNISNT